MEPFHTANLKYRVRPDDTSQSPPWPPVDYEVDDRDDAPSTFAEGFLLGMLASTIAWFFVVILALAIRQVFWGG